MSKDMKEVITILLDIFNLTHEDEDMHKAILAIVLSLKKKIMTLEELNEILEKYDIIFQIAVITLMTDYLKQMKEN